MKNIFKKQMRINAFFVYSIFKFFRPIISCNRLPNADHRALPITRDVHPLKEISGYAHVLALLL